MHAIQMTKPGPPQVLQPVELPEPVLTGPTQVKVRLQAAGVNPIDTKLRARGVFFPDALPAVLGCDGAGVVVEVGAAVTRHKVGDEVWFCHGGLGREQGNYAQYTVLDQDIARNKPASLTFAEAAAAPLVLITAWEALYDRARLQSGHTVLIHAGAGGVGHVAIQLAKHAGARVAVTVGSEDTAAFARSLGADHTILYREEDFVAAIEDWTEGRGVDVLLDTIGGETFQRSLAAAAHYGDVVTLLDPGPDVVWKEARNRNLRVGFELMLTPMLRDLPAARAHHAEILDACARHFDAGELKIHVSETLPLADAPRAHAHIEQGHARGKIVLSL